MMGLFPVKWTPTFASLTLCCNIEGDFELRVLFRYFGTLDFCHTAGENVCFAGSEVDLFAVEPFILFFFWVCEKCQDGYFMAVAWCSDSFSGSNSNQYYKPLNFYI